MAQMNEVAAQIMEHMCSHDGDSGHGYTQGARWGSNERCHITVDNRVYSFSGGDRDCSSAVISAYQAAGLDVKATYTGNMKSAFLATGKFAWKPMSFTAQRGDIYLNQINHTAMCVSAVPDLLSEFCISENGTIYGKQGDQTGRESVNRKAYYNYPWDGILHFTGGAASGGADKPSKPTGQKEKVFWRVKQDGKWLQENYAGNRNKPITAIAINMHGHGWYQVCTKKHGWLSRVRGYDIADEEQGYAGYEDSPVIAVRVYYETPDPEKTGYFSAKYRVSELNASWFDWQFDNDTWNGQDGYAGDYKPIDRFELTLE